GRARRERGGMRCQVVAVVAVIAVIAVIASRLPFLSCVMLTCLHVRSWSRCVTRYRGSAEDQQRISRRSTADHRRSFPTTDQREQPSEPQQGSGRAGGDHHRDQERERGWVTVADDMGWQRRLQAQQRVVIHRPDREARHPWHTDLYALLFWRLCSA